VYSDDDLRARERALSTYSRLLPGWDMVTICVDDLVESGGALHCISRNLKYPGRHRPSSGPCELPDLSPRYPEAPGDAMDRGER
jgi:hypothetical protein